MHTLHDYGPSGNCYKVRLTAAHLSIPLRREIHDLKKGEGRTAGFRERFPLGRVPVLQLEDGTLLAESNAIILFLAEGSSLIPSEKIQRAEMMQWLFWEQYSHEPNIATVRAWLRYFGVPTGKESQVKQKQEAGVAALQVMEKHLSARAFFVGEKYSLADIALFAYTHVAGEGDFDLSVVPSINAWIERVKSQPQFIAISA